jgi:hypothetical protein
MNDLSPIRLECMWCGTPFEPRRDGGRAQRFCSPTCRRALDAAVRRYVNEALACGTLTIARLKAGPVATRALSRQAEQPTQLPDIEPHDPAILAMLRVRGRVVLRLPISPEGVYELVLRGWLPRRSCHDATAITDAVISLANAAFDRGLAPG